MRISINFEFRCVTSIFNPLTAILAICYIGKISGQSISSCVFFNTWKVNEKRYIQSINWIFDIVIYN